MPFSHLVKRFGGVSQIFINFVRGGVKSENFQTDRSYVNFVCRFIKETIITINAEVTRMVKTSICKASYHVLGDLKITSGI